MIKLANISNGLCFEHDDVCHFQSQHGHNCAMGYFRIDSMPYKAIIHILNGGNLEIVDATRHNKPLTDAMKFGIPTWCLVFNRAIHKRDIRVCDWETIDMRRNAFSDIHKPLVQSIRKLVKYYGYSKPAVIDDNIKLKCHQMFVADDNPKRIRELIHVHK